MRFVGCAECNEAHPTEAAVILKSKTWENNDSEQGIYFYSLGLCPFFSAVNKHGCDLHFALMTASKDMQHIAKVVVVKFCMESPDDLFRS